MIQFESNINQSARMILLKKLIFSSFRWSCRCNWLHNWRYTIHLISYHLPREKKCQEILRCQGLEAQRNTKAKPQTVVITSMVLPEDSSYSVKRKKKENVGCHHTHTHTFLKKVEYELSHINLQLPAMIVQKLPQKNIHEIYKRLSSIEDF